MRLTQSITHPLVFPGWKCTEATDVMLLVNLQNDEKLITFTPSIKLDIPIE